MKKIMIPLSRRITTQIPILNYKTTTNNAVLRIIHNTKMQPRIQNKHDKTYPVIILLLERERGLLEHK